MSLEIQDLPDVVRVVALMSLSESSTLDNSSLKRRIDRIWASPRQVEISDLDKALQEMAAEGLVVTREDGIVELTPRGSALRREWRNLLLKREPVLEVVAGLADGSITALIVILSAVLAGLQFGRAAFAAFLTLSSVAITNFSSFFLGGTTEDLADMLSIQYLINYSLSDIPDKLERDKSLSLVKQIFAVLRREINRTNVNAALLSCTTTLLAGGIPIISFLIFPKPLNIYTGLILVGISGLVLVRYRSRRAKSHWRMTLVQTLAIIAIAVTASLLLGRGI